MKSTQSQLYYPLRFNIRECSGAFGDIGTDLPLIIGVILASGMNGAWVFMLFGIAQIISGMYFRMPMPVQPLKVMAVLIITQQISPDIIMGGGLAIATIMLFITGSGLLDKFATIIPLCVVRGIQCALGIKLMWLAAGTYITSQGLPGMLLAMLVMCLLLGGRYAMGFPLSPIAILVGATVSFLFLDIVPPQYVSNSTTMTISSGFTPDAILTGLLLLALPQLPLSLSNAMVATHQTVKDLFPERDISIRKLGYSYVLHNFGAALLGGIPVCHGAGGLAGHYAFGGRTGGSVVIYGISFILMGALISVTSLEMILLFFPLPVLGVLLLFEGTVLAKLLTKVKVSALDIVIALFTILIALTLTNGFILALLSGMVLYHGINKIPAVSMDKYEVSKS